MSQENEKVARRLIRLLWDNGGALEENWPLIATALSAKDRAHAADPDRLLGQRVRALTEAGVMPMTCKEGDTYVCETLEDRIREDTLDLAVARAAGSAEGRSNG